MFLIIYLFWDILISLHTYFLEQGTEAMGRSNKRTKRDDSSLESSPSNSVSSMLQTPKSSDN